MPENMTAKAYREDVETYFYFFPIDTSKYD
jgi:hypothetical protein